MNTPLSISVAATIDIQPEHRVTVIQALLAAVVATRREDGCEHYALHQDVDHPDRVMMLERWRDEASLDAHAQGTAFRTLTHAIDGKATLDVIRLHAFPEPAPAA